MPIALVVQIVEAALVRLVRVDLVHAVTEIANHEDSLLNHVPEIVAYADVIARQ